MPSPPALPRTTNQAGAARPLVVRITHWVNAVAMTCMILSGWRIYDASPLFAFSFPPGITLGGWLGGAIAWHLAAMWLLVVNGAAYAAYGLLFGYFRRTLLPLAPRQLLRDFIAALTFRLQHQAGGGYNAVQKLLYIVVLLLGAAVILSGLAVWKPVQFSPLIALLGGYDGARVVHFLAMTGIVGFIAVHLALVVLVPRTLASMITGTASRTGHGREART